MAKKKTAKKKVAKPAYDGYVIEYNGDLLLEEDICRTLDEAKQMAVQKADDDEIEAQETIRIFGLTKVLTGCVYRDAHIMW